MTSSLISPLSKQDSSSFQNRAAALRVLKSRLLAMKHEQEAAEAADMRHSQVRSLDRSERIRTYNFPENRIVDHRTNYKPAPLSEGEPELFLQWLPSVRGAVSEAD